MRLLITGATGFIGARLVVLARDAGHEVVATGAINNPAERERSELLASSGIDVVVGSLLAGDLASAVTRGCDAVVHLAAAQHETHLDDEHFQRVNVEGTTRLLQAAANSGVRRFVYGSTIGIYGGCTGARLDEASPADPGNAYTRTKLRAEVVVRGWTGVPAPTVMRIAETYGPGDLRLLKLFRAIKRGRFLMIGPGHNRHALVHVDDVARGLLLGVTRPEAAGETFVLAAGDDLTTHEMVTAIAAAVGRAVPRLRSPFWPFLVAATAGEKLLKPLGLRPPLSRRSLDFFDKSFVLSIDKAATRLGYVPHHRFVASAGSTAHWYEAQGLI